MSTTRVQPPENVDACMAASFNALRGQPARHKRERVYRLLDRVLDAPLVSLLRQRFGDEETSGVVSCECGQKNRIDLRSTHDNDIGPKCGRCGRDL